MTLKSLSTKNMENEMATKKRPLVGSVEQWENREVGAEEEFVSVAPAGHQDELDAATGLRAISIRVPCELIEQYKAAGAVLGVGYQPLMRDAMQRVIKSYLEEAKQVISKKMENADKVEALQLKKAA